MPGKDTIAAVATGLTDSGIGIVRISGKDAVTVGDRFFRLKNGRRMLGEAETRKMYHGYAIDPESSEIIDEVMAVVMKAPGSFTGEDTVEIQCHGGIFVMKKILDTALRCGARMAEPGEFTKRAFLNGKMDLSRAEAVMDLIHSRNEYALASSINQLKGSLSNKIKKMRDIILYEMAFIESALDDPEHISLEGYQSRLLGITEELLKELKKLIDTSENGRWIREGINTVILGKPNAGKSSLLNCLVGEERAIVTDIAGTTRDILTEHISLGGVSLNVVDTAGIRSTEDAVEKIGVERAKKYAERADLILYVADGSVELDENDKEIMNFIRDKKVIVLLNKSDLEEKITEEDIREKSGIGSAVVRISAREGSGMADFEKRIKDLFFKGEIKSSSEIIITNMRHKEALQEAFDYLTLVRKSMDDGMPEDFYSIDMMGAYSSLGRIIGEEVDDDLVEEIFSKFCMGK